MHFSVEHDLPAPPAAVVDVLCDPAFHTELELPDLGRPEVVESSTTGTNRVLRLRYEYVGQLDGIAKKIIGDRKLTWLQDLELDVATMRGALTFKAESDPGRLHGEATVVLEAARADATRQRIEGDLRVKVPLIGGTAEKKLVPGIVRRLDIESAALAAALTNPK